MKKLFKAYYLTCHLLSQFEGIHSMLAEEDLFHWVLDFVKGKTTEKKFISDIGFLFGLGKRQLKKALNDYEKYKNEN